MKNFSFIVLTAIIAVAVAGCNPSEPQPNRSLVGTWNIAGQFGSVLVITENQMNFKSATEMPLVFLYTYTYRWFSNDSIEIIYKKNGEMTDYLITWNKVIFHTQDSVTITGCIEQTEVDAFIYQDITLVRVSAPQQQANLCDYFQNLRDNSNGGNFGSELAPVVNAFLETIDGSLSDEQKIEQVVIWLNSTNCGIGAETLCVSCIYTEPAQSEITIHYIADGVSQSVVMDIVMSNPMRYGGLHQ